MARKETMSEHCNALFMSDSHAFHPLNGALHKQARILHYMQPEQVHMVGDIVDWEAVVHVLKTQFQLTPQNMPDDFKAVYQKLSALSPHLELHLRSIDLLFEKQKQDVSIYYEPGNHDENMDVYDGDDLLGIKIRKEGRYEAGEHVMQVEHGHRFDPGWLKRHSDWYQKGSRLLDIALAADITLDKSAKYLGKNTKEAQKWVKKMLWRGEEFANERLPIDSKEQLLDHVCENFPTANGLKTIGKTYVRSFEKEAVSHAKDRKVDGIVCGHIHKARREIKKNGMVYINSGDGLTHGTAVIHDAKVSDEFLNQWQVIEAKKIIKLQGDWKLATDRVDPRIRNKTMEFLQAGWTACLNQIRQGNKPPLSGVSAKKRELVA